MVFLEFLDLQLLLGSEMCIGWTVRLMVGSAAVWLENLFVPCGMNQSLYFLTVIVAHVDNMRYVVSFGRLLYVLCTICSARLNGCVAFAFRNPSVCCY